MSTKGTSFCPPFSFPSPVILLKTHLPSSRTHRPLSRFAMTARLQHEVFYGPNPAILLTNDDGVHPEKALILTLAKHLSSRGHDVIVCAPGKNNSACGQKITLGADLTMRRHKQYELSYAPETLNGTTGSLRVYSIDEGTPADCVIAAIEPKTGLLARLGYWPKLALSGINNGQNVGTDLIYSGTFAAARQAAMYGVPGIAASLNLLRPDTNNPDHVRSILTSIDATIDLTHAALKILPTPPVDLGRLNPNRIEGRKLDNEYLIEAFARGDIVLNMNVPVEWNSEFEFSHLGNVLYREAVVLPCAPTGIQDDDRETLVFRMMSNAAEYMQSPGSDIRILNNTKKASITPVSTWPFSHPLALPERMFEIAVDEGTKWLPVCREMSSVSKI